MSFSPPGESTMLACAVAWKQEVVSWGNFSAHLFHFLSLKDHFIADVQSLEQFFGPLKI